MQPKDLIDQLLIKGLHNGFRVKLLSIDDFTIAVVVDVNEDNRVIDTYLLKDGKIVPLPLKDVLGECWQQHSPS